MDKWFEQKFVECEKSLYLIAFNYLHNSEDARDCIQDTAFSAYKSLKGLKNKDYFKTWITRILINKAKDMLKKRKFTEGLSDNLNIFEEIPEAAMDIVLALSKLKNEDSLYITLRFYNDMTYKEMSEVLNEAESTVKYRTAKALGELKIFLEEDIK